MRRFALVPDFYFHSLCQIRLFAQMTQNSLPVKPDLLENFRVRAESDGCAGLVHGTFSDFLYFVFRFSPLVLLGVPFALSTHLGLEFFGKSVYDRDADAVKAAGNFVRLAAEFAAGVKRGHDGFKRRFFRLFVNFNRNSTAVVNHPNRVVGQQRDFNVLGIAGHCFIKGIINDLPNQMVQAVNAG